MVHEALLILAAITLLGFLVAFIDLAVGSFSIPDLELQDPAMAPLPRVSIITAARNEEREIRQALQSILHMDYPNYEVIAVNDRSEDRTGAILEEMRTENPQLQVIHVKELPQGWLGKNHALFAGGNAAQGDMLLFSAADVTFAPSALSRAVGAVQRNGLDRRPLPPRLARAPIHP